MLDSPDGVCAGHAGSKIQLLPYPLVTRVRPVPGSHCLVGKRTVKACRTFDTGAKCWVTAGSVSMADGGGIAGTPAERIQQRAVRLRRRSSGERER